MQYIVYRSGEKSHVLCYRVESEAAVARYLEASGAPAMYEVTGVLADGDTMQAVNGKLWLEKYRLDQLRRAALDNTAPDDAPPAWHDDAWQVAQAFQYLRSDPNCPLACYTVNRALAMAISGIVRYQNLERETTNYQTICDYVWSLIRAMRTG